MKRWFKALTISFTAASAIVLLAASVSTAAIGSWAAGTAMGTVRQGATATVLSNGKVLVTGGETTGSAYLNTTETYTPTGSGTWAVGTEMLTTRAYHSARVLPNGKVMVMGGYNGSALSTTEIYDPASPSWTAGASMSTARQKFATVALRNGKIMVIGGLDGSSTVLKSTEIYNPTTNTWTAGPNLNTVRQGLEAVILDDGRVLVLGGNSGSTTLNTTEIYSQGTNIWAPGPNMTVARENSKAMTLADGKILVVGGYDGSSILNTTEIYSALTSSFTADVNISQASGRRYAAITQLQDGKILVAGGMPQGGTYLDTAEIGTFPSTNEQTTIPQVLDVANNGNARDIRVLFKGAPNEEHIQEYRVFVLLDTVDTTIANGADAASLDGVANRYAIEAKKGINRIHLFTLTEALTRAGGIAIDTTTGSYKVYVLAKGKPGYGDTLSAVSTAVAFKVAAYGAGVTLAAPTVLDSTNNHDITDIKFVFRRPKSESGYLAAGGAGTYRVYIVPNATTDATFRASSWFANANYDKFDKGAVTSIASSYIKNLTAGKLDSTGAAVIEGTAYRIYIVAVGASGTVDDSVLSPSSRVITLSPYVPGVFPIRSLSVAKTGTGFTSDLVQVTFKEPTLVTGIQDYRIFIVSSTATLTQALADTNATVVDNCYIYTPTPPTGLASRVVQLSAGIKAYDGTEFSALTSTGVYKVYVLSYATGVRGNKLSASSVGMVTLD